MKLKKLIGILAVAGLAAPGIASATNGYFSHGYGVKAQGMGGVGIALPQDALAAATNPAGMVHVGDRLDLGLTWFSPIREANINGGTTYKSSSDNFFVPEVGYNKMFGSNTSFGVSVFGNGGMNSDYDAIPQFNVAGNRTGVDLSQLFIAPTWSMKLNQDHSVGVALNLAYQRFKASGISNFGSVSSDSSSLSDKGYDSSTGWGVRIGWIGQVSPAVTLGATYQSRTWMSKLDKYKGLFAEQGDFDIPENFGVGIAIKANPKTTVALDVVRINYGDVKSIANPIANMGVAGYLLGQDNGIGFGWKNQTVYKLGMSYEYSKDLTLRAGYNHGNSTIPSTEIAFNVLAPATVEDHLTLGATWALANNGELSVAYMHAFDRSQSGVTPQLGGGTSTIKMYQNSLGVGYGMKF